MQLRDIPGATPFNDPISNPTYCTHTSVETAPLTVRSASQTGHTYSDLQFSSDSEEEEAHAYEDVITGVETPT